MGNCFSQHTLGERIFQHARRGEYHQLKVRFVCSSIDIILLLIQRYTNAHTCRPSLTICNAFLSSNPTLPASSTQSTPTATPPSTTPVAADTTKSPNFSSNAAPTHTSKTHAPTVAPLSMRPSTVIKSTSSPFSSTTGPPHSWKMQNRSPLWISPVKQKILNFFVDLKRWRLGGGGWCSRRPWLWGWAPNGSVGGWSYATDCPPPLPPPSDAAPMFLCCATNRPQTQTLTAECGWMGLVPARW